MEKLSPRERVQIALAHQEPDVVPIDLGEGRQTSIYPEPYLEAASLLGLGKLEISSSPRNSIDLFDESFLQALDIDFRRVSTRDLPEYQAIQSDGSRKDEWGITWRQSGPFWYHDDPLRNATLDDLRKYPWPDANDDRYYKGLREEAKYKWENTPYSLVAKIPHHTYGILSQSRHLRGMENFLADLIVNKEFAWELMDRVLAFHMRFYERYLEEVGDYIDIVQTADDLGTQTGPFLSPKLYREMIKPKEKLFFDSIKNKTKAKIWYHCDGAMSVFINDLIELGVDILNPVQATAKGMDPLELKKTYGDRISFHGGIDQQHVLSAGTIDDVREEVKLRISQLGPGGGYILAACHCIPPEVSGEKVIELFRSARKYGVYPIRSLT
jgi:uroporphyrinogen decarboxylase